MWSPPTLISCIILLLCLTTMTLAMSLSKPGCPAKCGNVTIPYPFGVGSNCSAKPAFTIICQNTSIPLLASINLEVVNISLQGVIRVKQPVSPMACTHEQRSRSLVTPLLGSPFTISASMNSLVVLGCQNAGWFRTNKTSMLGGCMALCDANATLHNHCNGVNCCQVSIMEEGLQELDFTYRSIEPVGRNDSFCGYAFLAADTWFPSGYQKYKGFLRDLSSPFDDEFRFVTLVLEWMPYNLAISSYASCGSRDYGSDYYYSSGYNKYNRGSERCSCDYGFDGNPYLPTGCQDIDECSRNDTRRYCLGICTNTIGSYTCESASKFKPSLIIIVGSVLTTVLLIAVAWRSSKVVIKKFKAKRKLRNFRRNGGLLLEKHELSATDKGVEKIKLFSSKDLAKATDRYNENRVLGRGGQGTVYKGMLTDGRIVAIKKSEGIDEDDIVTFINEVVILSQINHRNVVKLLGCCLESQVPLLVYEFIPNGNLYQHIHDPNEEFPLTWEMRVQIAIEVASSLSYLHSAASAPIYHRDIKSTNILLDEKYRAKIADFGTSRSVSIEKTHLTTRVLGTFGYLDPEYFQSSQFTEKSDVYSFGVVMVELLTGEKAVSTIRADVGRSLATHFLHSMDEDRLFDILDARVLKEGKKEQILAIAELASKCLHLHGKKRPTMKEVAAKLEAIQNLKEETVQQHDVEENERHSIEVSEFYDFSSIPGSTNFDSIIISRSSSSDAQPLIG